LSVVGKISTEVENHLGIADKDLAEFIIDLAKNNSLNDFKQTLNEEGGEFPQQLVENWHSFVNNMLNPPQKSNNNNNANDLKLEESEGGKSPNSFRKQPNQFLKNSVETGQEYSSPPQTELEVKKYNFPGLAIPDQFPPLLVDEVMESKTTTKSKSEIKQEPQIKQESPSTKTSTSTSKSIKTEEEDHNIKEKTKKFKK